MDTHSKISAKRILMHVCCGPCSVIPLKRIFQGRAEVWGYFHNPNIHPLSEFKKRLDAVKTLASLLSVNMIYDETYSPAQFIKGARKSSDSRHPAFGERCIYCYESRLSATAMAAARHGFDAFTSSLLYSKYQNHGEIRRLGETAAGKHGILFYYEDFRKGWSRGITESKKIGLYRQKYCGCVYSRIERFKDSKPAAGKSI